MVDVLLDRVSKRYGQHWAVRDLSLRVEHGEAVAMLGPSGSGKTTVIRLVAGLDKPTNGDVLFDGAPASPDPAKRGISMVFANNTLFPNMSARQNISFPLRVQRTDRAEEARRVDAEAAALGIRNLLERMPRTLSAGEASLVVLAKAMVRSPGLFLIDEPLIAIDPRARRALRTELRQLQRGYGATAIYATHDQEDAMTLADRLVVMDGGQIRQIGSPLNLYHEPEDVFVARFVGSPPMSFLETTRVPGGISLGDTILTAPYDTPEIVSLGVRPESWEVSAHGLDGTISNYEDHGSSAYICLDTVAGQATIRWDERPPTIGTQLRVFPSRFHIFDPVSGAALFHS